MGKSWYLERVIGELNELADGIDRMPILADLNMAIMYARHALRGLKELEPASGQPRAFWPGDSIPADVRALHSREGWTAERVGIGNKWRWTRLPGGYPVDRALPVWSPDVLNVREFPLTEIIEDF